MARLPQNVSENSGLTENSTVTAIPFSAINIPLLSVCLDHQPMQRAVGICSVVRYHRPDRAPSCDLYATPSAPIDQNAGRTFAVGTKTPRSMSPMVLQPVNAIAESSSPLQIGRASCSEKVFQYFKISVVAVT